jgi:hypothetical protein
MVVHGNRQGLLGKILTDDVLIQVGSDFLRSRQSRHSSGCVTDFAHHLFQFLANDVVAKLDAFIADEDLGTGDQTLDFMLALAAERAIQKFFVAVFISH